MGTICAIGLMSGTSMDGIDVAMLRTDGVASIEFGPSMFVAYEADFRQRLEESLEVAKGIERREDRPGDLSLLERELTLRHARAVERFLKTAVGDWGVPEVIGFHGQTVLHRPHIGVTVQLGDGALLAGELNMPVVYDMRANDMLHGGQGAPLVPAYHAALAASLRGELAGRHPVAFVNVGGISNITYVPRSGDPIAFDTGPGNTLIDQWVQREGGVPYDAGGTIASEGGVVEAVVARYMEAPFFRRSGPKSLDRNDFTLEPMAGLELSDGARTLAAVSAEAILRSVEHMSEPPKLWIVCGGGRKNPHIVGDLVSGGRNTGAEVIVAEEAGLDGDSTEAEAWAFLAVRSMKGLPLTFPTTTGCRKAVSGGVMAKP